jgi:predicted nucleic acid-binding protein
LQQAISAIGIYEEISMEIVDVSISKSIELASKYNMYAYDVYILQCAIQENVPLLTLDKELADIAQKAGVQVLQV